MLAILDELVNRIQPEMQAQITKWGGNYNTWQNNVQAIRDFILQRCAYINQGLVNCYNLTGPFEVLFDVYPPGSGYIKLNTSQIGSYPYQTSFLGGNQNNLEALANNGYSFSHWEILHNTLNPSTSNPNVTVTFNSTDTVIAHFTQIASPRQIVYIVEPPNSGTITANAYTPSTYPWTGVYADSTLLNLTATPEANYNFANWHINNHSIIPGNTVPQGQFLIVADDTVIAYFDTVQLPTEFTLTVSVRPIYTGTVLLNQTVSIDNSHYEIYNTPTPISLKATPNSNYDFSHWEINNHVLNPNNFSEEVSFTINQNEHIIAYFNPEEITVFLPNSFSPNSDGLNDGFTVRGNSELDYCEIYIYNRWGQLIYSSKELDFVWDGYYKNEKCPMDAYTYIFIYSITGSEQKHYAYGSVVLVR